MRTHWLALSTILTVAAALPAQDYRWEQSDQLGVKFKVHRKLTPVPTKIGTADPHTKVQYEAGDASDKVRGIYSWYLWVLEFPKGGGAVVKKTGEGTTTSGKEEAEPESPLHCADFREWATEKDPHIKDRTYQEKAVAVKAKGKSMAYDYWEFSDSNSGDDESFWYSCAAVYDFPDRQIVLHGVVPAIGKAKPKEALMKFVKTMIASLEVLDAKEIVTSDEPDSKRDEFANTPERQAELEKAKKNIANLDGWDYFTSPNYICLYSWDPKKKEKRKPATDFAHEIVDDLEAMRELYQKEFPPHEKMVPLYSILRICNNYDDFYKYSGMGGGVVGFFSPSSKELVIFDDKDRYFGNKQDTIYSTAMHEGWHQYGYTYFGEKAELHRWFDEGTGDFFGSWSRKGKNWNYETSKSRFVGVKNQVARKTYINPRELVTWEVSKFYGSPRVVDHYEQAYSMVDFMKRGAEVMGKKFDPLWGTVLDKYRVEMIESKDHKKAVEKAFTGVDWDAYETAWRDWVMNYMK